MCLLPRGQQVAVLPESSPTAALRAQPVIVSDVRPRDAANPPPTAPPTPRRFCSQFLSELCVVM